MEVFSVLRIMLDNTRLIGGGGGGALGGLHNADCTFYGKFNFKPDNVQVIH